MTNEDFYIPLTQSILSDKLYGKHLYIYLTVMRNQIIRCRWNFSKHSLYYVCELNGDFNISRAACGMHRNNFYKVAKQIPLDQFYTNESICLVPFEVWDNWNKWISQFEMRARNSWTRLFFYIYFNADRWNNGFTDSIENIAAALQMDKNDVSAKLIALEKSNWIDRSFYLVAESARTYSIKEPWLSYSMRLKKAQSM